MKVTTKIRIMHGGLRVANFITERSDDLPCAFFAELVLRGGTVTAGYADVPGPPEPRCPTSQGSRRTPRCGAASL
eukprot:CAMPEP_0167794152 /NCGR_PEP_ID=MMETSP0111_2-20121227/13642_1 /TAXON_ID=91324 /ORGANISM="Lotharella globosa, Strain CCCM811" /LENGTH=74 /DNA_ID=CAMNT_0007687519 /DNA_START=222 /DNA_END=446 /DNA_ORIENTATION=+